MTEGRHTGATGAAELFSNETGEEWKTGEETVIRGDVPGTRRTEETKKDRRNTNRQDTKMDVAWGAPESTGKGEKTSANTKENIINIMDYVAQDKNMPAFYKEVLLRGLDMVSRNEEKKSKEKKQVQRSATVEQIHTVDKLLEEIKHRSTEDITSLLKEKATDDLESYKFVIETIPQAQVTAETKNILNGLIEQVIKEKRVEETETQIRDVENKIEGIAA